jgi:hypothetical protein
MYVLLYEPHNVHHVLWSFFHFIYVLPCNVNVVGQFQTSYESMCSLINNILHNLTWDQWDATQSNEIKLLISYVSYWHALKTFEVELFKWEMEVGVMRIEFLHNIILQWGKKTIDWLRKHLEIGTQSSTCFHPINTFWKRC